METNKGRVSMENTALTVYVVVYLVECVMYMWWGQSGCVVCYVHTSEVQPL